MCCRSGESSATAYSQSNRTQMGAELISHFILSALGGGPMERTLRVQAKPLPAKRSPKLHRSRAVGRAGCLPERGTLDIHNRDIAVIGAVHSPKAPIRVIENIGRAGPDLQPSTFVDPERLCDRAIPAKDVLIVEIQLVTPHPRRCRSDEVGRVGASVRADQPRVERLPAGVVGLGVHHHSLDLSDSEG